MITTHLEHARYNPNPTHTSFQTTLLAIFYYYDNLTYTHTTGPLCTSIPTLPITTRQSMHHRSIQSTAYLWARKSPPILPDHKIYLVHTFGLVSALPPNNYTRTSMNIIDNIYIGILPIALCTTITAYLATIFHYQTITNQWKYPPNKNHHASSYCTTTKQNTTTH